MESDKSKTRVFLGLPRQIPKMHHDLILFLASMNEIVLEFMWHFYAPFTTIKSIRLKMYFLLKRTGI